MKKIIISFLLTFFHTWLFSQNVGIGISVPSSKLHVSGNVRVDNGTIKINDPFASLYLTASNQNRGFFQLRGANYDVDIGTSPLNTTGNFSIQTNGVDRMIVRPDGKVGIGVANPSYQLTLDGEMSIEDGALQLYNKTNNISWRLYNSMFSNAFLIQENLYPRFVITNGGNVGIGVLSPQENLEVFGNIKTFGGEMIIENPTAILQLQSNAIKKGFVQLSGDNLRLGTNGGNTAGEVIIRMDGTDLLNIKKTVSAGTSIQMNLNGVSTGVLQTTSAGNVSLTALNANTQVQLGGEVFINNTANRTGIGTSSPTERLHVNGNMIVTGSAVINAGRITASTTGSAYNLLPLAYGRVTYLGNKAGGTPNFTSATRTGPGAYDVFVTGLTSSSVIMITPGSISSIEMNYDSPGKFRVRIWSSIYDEFNDTDFHFIIYNP